GPARQLNLVVPWLRLGTRNSRDRQDRRSSSRKVKATVLTMKSPFFWRIVICVVPTLIALAVTRNAVRNYIQGKGGFKLGAALVGGTILVYEVDPEKKPPDFQIEKLVEALSPRINPADQKGITIRAVGKDRIEIILPTGGKHQAQVEEEVWQDLLKHVK